MTRLDPVVDSSHPPEGIARRHARITLRLLGSLLLGGVAVLGSMALFRQGLLPLIDMTFQPGPEWLSAIRRTGMVLAAVGGYWAFVHWHEKRAAAELKLRPVLCGDKEYFPSPTQETSRLQTKVGSKIHQGDTGNCTSSRNPTLKTSTGILVP